MKNSRLLTLFMAIIATFAFLFTGCTAEPRYSVDEDGNIVVNKPMVLRFAAPEGKFETEIESFKAGFKKLYPQVTIKFEPIAGDWTSQLIMQLGTGSAPDIFWTDEVFSYASKGQLEPLDDYFASLNVNKNDFYESMLDIGKYENKLYMMPREYNKVVTFYNKRIFDAVFSGMSEDDLPFTPKTGTHYPADGWTWSEFVDTAEKIVLKQGSDIVRRGADISLTWGSCGPTIFEGLGGTIKTGSGSSEAVNFNNSENLRIMTDIYNLMGSGAFVNPTKPDTGEFINGKVGMVFSSRPDCSSYQNAFNDDWDVVSFPLLPQKAAICTGCSGYVVNANSKVKEMAIRLLFYMVSEEGQSKFCETGNCVPVLKSMKDSEVWRSHPRTTINHEAFLWGEQYDTAPYKFNFTSELAKGKFESAWKDAMTNLVKQDSVSALSSSMSSAQITFNGIFDKYSI